MLFCSPSGWNRTLAMPTSQSMIVKRSADQRYGNTHDGITSKPLVSTASSRTHSINTARSFRRVASPAPTTLCKYPIHKIVAQSELLYKHAPVTYEKLVLYECVGG